MFELVRLFVRLALFKKGPQDVPYSLFLLIALFVASFLFELLTYFIPGQRKETVDFLVFLRYLIVANIVFVVVTYLIFKLHGHSKRFLQSLTAMLGIDLLMSVILLPVNLIIVFAGEKQFSLLLTLMALFYLLFFSWYLFVYLHIFRHGLSVSPLVAGMLSLAMFALGMSLSSLLLPGASA